MFSFLLSQHVHLSSCRPVVAVGKRKSRLVPVTLESLASSHELADRGVFELATLLRASRGHGTVAGCDVMGDPVGVRQAVGYMPDMFGVYDGMKVWEFLDFFALAYAIPRNRRKQVITDVLTSDDFRDRIFKNKIRLATYSEIIRINKGP